MLVGQIAWKHLNKQGGASPEILYSLQNAINSIVTYSPPSETFTTATCWMDDIKSRGITEFSNWHFINLPICDFPDSTDPDSCNGVSVQSVLTNDDEDILWAISSALNTIKNKYALGFERGFAVRTLLHLVGDIHQPLHAVARYSQSYPNGDAGGNLFPISNVPFANNLHKFWDSGVGMLNNDITRPLDNPSASYISTIADSIIQFTANLTNNVKTFNISQWAVDSRTIAMTYCYNLTENSTPSPYYISQGWKAVQQQLGLAGYRLYLLLKQIRLCDDTLQNCPTNECEGSDSDNNSEGEEREKPNLVWAFVILAFFIISVLANVIVLAIYCRQRLSRNKEYDFQRMQ